MSSVMSLQEENRVLQAELGRVEDLLANSRADRDELAIKYGAISERVRQGSRTQTTQVLRRGGGNGGLYRYPFSECCVLYVSLLGMQLNGHFK